MNKFNVGDRVKKSDQFLQHLDESELPDWIDLRGVVVEVRIENGFRSVYDIDWGDWGSTNTEIYLEKAEDGDANS